MKKKGLKTFTSPLKPSSPASSSSVWCHRELSKLGFFPRPSSSSLDHRLRFKIVGQSLGDRWKLNDIDTSAVQETFNSWLSKTENFLNEALVKTGHSGKPDRRNEFDSQEMEDIFMTEQTIDRNTPNGILSLAAIVSIDQFCRMNGLTGQKMQKIFIALVPESVYSDARNLVEYCWFRFLSTYSSDIHPCLKVCGLNFN
ncbi:hypothetical protein Patl1_35547 [Pistacia atlantica]|nr:hypothetical protein Patl1_35547 [Pistacia atlantica]